MIVCMCVYIYTFHIYKNIVEGVYVKRILKFRVKEGLDRRGRLKNREESNDVRRIEMETGGTRDKHEDNFKLMLYCIRSIF